MCAFVKISFFFFTPLSGAHALEHENVLTIRFSLPNMNFAY